MAAMRFALPLLVLSVASSAGAAKPEKRPDVDETAVRNPRAVVDIIRGAFTTGMRDFTFNLDSNEFVRITGYLVRKSDLAAAEAERRVRHTSDHLAAGSERSYHLTERAVKRIGCRELDPR